MGLAVNPRTPEYSGVKEPTQKLFLVGSEEVSALIHNFSIPEHETQLEYFEIITFDHEFGPFRHENNRTFFSSQNRNIKFVL